MGLSLPRWGLFCFVYVLCVAVGISKCTETILFVPHPSHSSFRYVTNYVISNTLLFNVLKIPKKKGDPWEVGSDCCELLPHGSLAFSSLSYADTCNKNIRLTTWEMCCLNGIYQGKQC